MEDETACEERFTHGTGMVVEVPAREEKCVRWYAEDEEAGAEHVDAFVFEGDVVGAAEVVVEN